MNLNPSLVKTIFFRKRFWLSIILMIAFLVFLFLVSSFFIIPDQSGKTKTLLLLVIVATVIGLTILLNQRIFSFLSHLVKKAQGIHPEIFTEKGSEDDLALLDTCLDKIEKSFKEKEKEIKDVKSRLIALNAVATAVSQTLDVDQILNEVLGIILEVTGFDGGIIFLVDEEDKNIQMRAWRGLQMDGIWKFDPLQSDQGIVSEAVTSKQTILVSNVEENQKWPLEDFQEKGIKTLLVVPFVAKRKAFGALTLLSMRPRDPSLEEIEFLEAVGQQMGMTIDNLGLLSEWTKKAHDLSVLVETSGAFSTSLNQNQVLDILTQRMMKALEGEFCWTALVDQKKGNISFEIFLSLPGRESPKFEKSKTMRMEHFPLHQKVVKIGRMIKIGEEDQLTFGEEKLFPKGSRGEMILLPLSVSNRVLGVVGVGLPVSEKLKSEKLNLCRSIASQAAFAIDNARLYEDARQKAEEVFSLYQVAQRLSYILDWDQLLEQILKVIVESFGYLHCAILLMDKKKKELFVKASSGFPDRRIKNKRIKVGEEGITGWVAQTGEPVVVEDVSKDPRYIMGMKECQSEVAVPIKLKGEVIGVFDAESDKLFAFGEKDVRILSQLALQIAVVLENSLLYSEEKKRNVQLALINDVGRKVVSTLNLDQLLESTIEVIQLSFKYDHISLFLMDEFCRDLILKTFCGKSDNMVKPGYRQKIGVGMVGKAAESGKSVLCNDVSKDPHYIPAIKETLSELSVPIKSGKMVMGVLDVENFSKDTFDEQDVAVLETVCDLLATAMNNSKLYAETKRKASRLELTDRITRAISSTLDLKGIFDVVSGELSKIMEYDRISLNFWYPEEHLFKMEMSSSAKRNVEPKEHQSISADETPMHHVVQTQKSDYQPKLVLDENSKSWDRLIFSQGTRSYLLVPIINNDEVIAVLSLESRKEHAFQEEQIELLCSIASHLSVAIQNAKLFSDLEETYQNLKNTQSHMIQMERFRAIGEMASGIVHDFNNVLASILGRVQLLLLKLKKEGVSSTDKMMKSLEVIEKSALDGSKILSRIREFTKEKPETEFCPIDLNQLVEDSVEMTKAYWIDKVMLSGIPLEIKKELKSKGMISGDTSGLREVLTNLIINAVNAMPDGGTLTLRTQEDEESIFLAVEDTGIGMTEEVRSKIFVPFFTTKGEEGTGLGLSLVHGIVTRHRGEIKVDSMPGRGSSFTVKLPRCNLSEEKQTSEVPKGGSASILVIEDEKNIREVLDEMLSTAGHKVTQAASGEEGIELFRKQKVDIVITDLGMPGLSGWEVADKIKAQDPHTPVIISTGWGVKHDQMELHKQKIDRIISKPFNMEQILNLVSELLAQRKTDKLTELRWGS